MFALDNRCPHLGFPLHRGSVEDGILTCHWHHARFDLASGCTFDLWADDVPTAAVELRDGVVWVCPHTRYTDGDAHWRNRLREGLEQNIGLVLAKAVLGLIGEGVDYRAMVRDAVLFGARNRDGWGIGLTILTALAKLIPCLPEEETYLALYKGISRVARDCDGAAPRRDRLPLAPRQFQPLPVLERWFRHWTRVRHRDAAERTLLTAIASGASSIELATLMLTAVTDRYFADGGHALDFTNKAFESLDIIGWEHAPASASLSTKWSVRVAARSSMPGASQSIWCRCAKPRSPNCRSSWPTAERSAEAGEAARCWRGCFWAMTRQRSWRLSSQHFATVRRRRISVAQLLIPQLGGLPCLASQMSIRTGRRRSTVSPTVMLSTKC